MHYNITRFIILYQPYNTPLYRLYNRKNPKDWRPKMVTYPCISLATNPAIPWIFLTIDSKSIYQLTTSRSSHTCSSTSCLLIFNSISSTSNLPISLPRPSTYFQSTSTLTVVDPPRPWLLLIHLNLWLPVDLPWLYFHCKEYNNPTF